MEQKSKLSTLAVIIDHLVAPFYRTGTTGSFGRLWSSILICLMCGRYWVFVHKPFDPPDSMVNITLALLAYVFGTKGLDIYKDIKTAIASSKPTEPKSDDATKESEGT
jgi:hypothetical protein